LLSGAAITLALVGLIIGIVISPLALQLLAKKKLNWSLFSNIGQSYGAVSAILSALAFLGIALALILQVRQSRESRIYSIRELHSNLLRMGMADSRYLEAWGNFSASVSLDRDVTIYANLMMNYLASLYETRAADLEEVRYYAREIFDGEVGRVYWESCRGAWLKFSRGRAKRLAWMIEDEYQRAVISGPPQRPLHLATEQAPIGRSKKRSYWIFRLRRR
jgi:hypothetical protein